MSIMNLLLSVTTALSMIPQPTQMTPQQHDGFLLNKPYKVLNLAGQEAQNVYLDQLLTPANEKRASRVFILKHEPMASEGYRLHITPDSLIVAANDREGFIHAAVTLKQLMDGERRVIPSCDISDAPRYGWRGCMIDVSRHYFDTACLRQQIDLLAMLKMNRLHLHLVDAAGWRMEIKRYPLLTDIAAWRTVSDWQQWWVEKDRRYCQGPQGAYGGYYTQQELRELVAYAAERGITIVPEIEMPGHSEEVLAVYPQLACTSDTAAVRNAYPAGNPAAGFNAGDLCPSSDATFQFLCNVLDEVIDVFPSQYIHIGGDEANMTAWRTCSRCIQHMSELNTDQMQHLQADLIARISQHLAQRGRRLVGWDEIINDGNDPQPRQTAMIWRNADYARRAIENGYDVVMAPNSHCYVNRSQDAPQPGEITDGNYLPFSRVMEFDPLAGLDAEQQSHVLGVQACLWTEHVEGRESLENHLYPRLFAIAQVGWGGKVTDAQAFRKISEEKADQLREQGVAAFDLKNEVGERKESLQPVNHLALNAVVTYLKPYNRYYPANKTATLTDGWRGGWHHGDGKWQGFIGDSCVNVVIDLGKETQLHSVSLDFIQNAGPDIYLPAWLTISASSDGVNYRQLYRRDSDKDTRRGLSFHTWQWTGDTTARYLHIVATSHDHRSWIFTDEVIVE